MATAKAVAWLDTPHRIEGSAAEQVRATFRIYRPEPVVTVPTRGDWQLRNWHIDGAELKIIDLGRYQLTPAASDLCRLAALQ